MQKPAKNLAHPKIFYNLTKIFHDENIRIICG